MTLELKLAEERKEGYAEGAAAGAAQQRARDESELLSKESELKAKESQLKAQSDIIAQYEKLYGKLD